jgi:hypothetical protein
MKKKHKETNLDKSLNRQEAVEQGYYDGRFRNRVIPNKKKNKNKFKARGKMVDVGPLD